jgi:pimeloyl-ACP methyl ester carboxylesterase
VKSSPLRCLASEVLAYGFHGLLTPLVRPPPTRASDDRSPTVLFIHGYGGGPGGFVLLRRALEGGGFRSFAGWHYRTTGSVSRLALELDRWVREHLAGRELLVVAHSLGGILARYWLQELGGREHAAAFISLSSPHRGVDPVPGSRLVPVIRELAVGGPLVRRLERGASALDGLPCVSVVSEWDHFVRPYERARFSPAELVRVDAAGHVGVLFDRSVHKLLVDRLTAIAPPPRPGIAGDPALASAPTGGSS